MEIKQGLLLWSSIREGDSDAFKQLYDEHSDVLFSCIIKRVENKQDAEDILQDVFLTLWENKEKIYIKTSLFSYIFSIMRFKVLRYLQGQKLTDAHNTAWAKLSDESVPEMNIVNTDDEALDMLQHVAGNLPTQLKKVYTLHIEEGFSIEDVAKELHLSEHTVKNYLKEIRKKMRVHLSKIANLLFSILIFFL